MLILEREYYELGTAKHGTPEVGVSIISLFATITDVLCGYRLAVHVQPNRFINKVSLIKYNEKGEIVEEIE